MQAQPADSGPKTGLRDPSFDTLLTLLEEPANGRILHKSSRTDPLSDGFSSTGPADATDKHAAGGL